jgi:hypothetical protein
MKNGRIYVPGEKGHELLLGCVLLKDKAGDRMEKERWSLEK